MSDRHARLAASVAALRDVTVLCAGDVMLDRFVTGTVDRISPEAPIPVLRVTRETAMLGGAGNVVRNLVGLGARTLFLSVVGDDATGHAVAGMLGELAGVTPILEVEGGRATAIKTRYVAGGQQLLRADRETVAAIAPAREEALARAAARALEGGEIGAVVLSDYGKGVLTDSLTARLIALAEARGVPVIVDPKGADYGRYRGAGLVTPNRKELHEATGLPTASDAEVETAARAVVERCGVRGVLATRSQDGMTLLDAAGTVLHLPAEAREVFDVSGAGDTVVATVAAALAAGLPVADASALANVAAGIVVGKVGTAAVHAVELENALRHQDLEDAEAKILPLERAAERAEAWRRRGLTVGFTNGCFDLLHPGHLSLLRQARAGCDRLIVGLNSDASVRGLKGPTRPVQNEAARSAVLASLSMVDGVVIFSEPTPLRLIETLRPDVLVKGADYTVETVVGADRVLGWGGKVLLASLEPGQSTTNTIRRMSAPE
ncbi:D-glycero-beta-D-manno-heptose-7-phosphate kinase [Novispirillum sp. DQ9]|uniref:D-glycero-beta-D-manno-heptose-7-phosphate kinase n=1 Tax=Novispirillum sp. DQ9 TaxID=3398612 RepID=UPI003C7A6651